MWEELFFLCDNSPLSLLSRISLPLSVALSAPCHKCYKHHIKKKKKKNSKNKKFISEYILSQEEKKK